MLNKKDIYLNKRNIRVHDHDDDYWWLNREILALLNEINRFPRSF